MWILRKQRRPSDLDLGNDVIVHLDSAKHLLVMIDLEDDVVVHMDYAEHRLVMTDLGDDVIIHVG